MAKIDTASYAFAGTGEVDEGNAAKLLDDLLPQSIGAVYRPKRVPRSNKALSGVINWLESDDVLGPKGTVPSEDLIQDLLARREAGDEITLVVTWPAEPSEDELELVKKAFDEGIPVKNLAAALDDLIQAEVFPEPEPEATKPPFDPPYTDTETGETVEGVESRFTPLPADAVAGFSAEKLAAFIDARVSRLFYDFATALAKNLSAQQDEVEKAAQSVAASKAAKADKPKARSRSAVKSQAKSTPPEEIEDGDGRSPKFSGGSQSGSGDEEKIAYYMDGEKGTYRRAKTRPRRGETRVMLTTEEIDDLVQKDLVTE